MRVTGPTRSPSAPLLAGQAFTRRLFLPVRSHVDVATTRPTLGADDLVAEPRDLGIGWIFRHIDKALRSARIVQAISDEAPHAQLAHVAECHRGPGGFLGFAIRVRAQWSGICERREI